MNKKHLSIRVEQCLALAKASNCPRRKFGALLLDPERNVILMDGYNGAPRGGGKLCGGYFCERDGFLKDKVEVQEGYGVAASPSASFSVLETQVNYDDVKRVAAFRSSMFLESPEETHERAEAWVEEMVAGFPPIPSGTRMERGCHHAEMNVICNAAANGVQTKDAWLIVTGEPCRMCAKLIHHAGIAKVLCVKGGYAGGGDGPAYLKGHGVAVEYVEGPQDPRVTRTESDRPSTVGPGSPLPSLDE